MVGQGEEGKAEKVVCLCHHIFLFLPCPSIAVTH